MKIISRRLTLGFSLCVCGGLLQAGCGTSTTSTNDDLQPAADLAPAVTEDLAPPVTQDLAKAPDLAQEPDLAPRPDLGVAPDLQNAVTYTADAKPIYQAHCAPCHTTGDSGGVDFATVYADTQKAPNNNVAICANVTTVGACTLLRIKAGQMPLGAGCTGNPTTDAGKAACLTAAEQDVLSNWIAGGELQ